MWDYPTFMKTGLIIQGPIVSSGFGPSVFNPDGVYHKNWIEYDARQNILKTLAAAADLFDHIVIATWKTELDLSHFFDVVSLDRLHIVQITEDSFLSEMANKGIHKYHQVKTTLGGLELLSKLGCEVVAKIRTDHGLNLDLLHNEVLRHLKKNPKALGVPNLNLFEIDRLTDFYFVGNVDTAQTIFAKYLSTPEVCDDVHADYFYKFATTFSDEKKYVPATSSPRSLNQYQLTQIWTSLFYPLDRRLFKDFYWRGIKVNYRLNSWVRYFFLLHSNSNRSLRLKSVLNSILIYSIPKTRKPTIKLTSWYLFRYHRYRSNIDFKTETRNH